MKKQKTQREKDKKLLKDASKAMQDHFRRVGGPCYGEGLSCLGYTNVRHHHFHWGQSAALRFEESNLVPLCSPCHQAFHKGSHRVKTNYEREMHDTWGKDWEDKLLEIEQNYIKRCVPDQREYLLNLIKFYEGNASD